MAKKRKDGCPLDINEDPRIIIDRNEIMKLTKVAKSWEFTCSFCFKKFPSAQAMGGHQNAHRSERLEEKRLFVRDPIGYRKRAYLRAMKSENSSTSTNEVAPNPGLNLHAAAKMVKNETANFNVVPKILPKPRVLPGDDHFGEFNNAANGNNYLFQPSTSKDSPAININGEKQKTVMNFLPPKELSLAESVGVHADDVKGKACIEYNVGGHGVNLDQKVDLTLKL